MPTNVIVLVVVVVAATTIGLAFHRYNGHFRGAAKAEVPVRSTDGRRIGSGGATDSTGPFVSRDDLDEPFGERATLLQFSSAFCAPCRSARRVLGEVATMVPGVAHIEVDAEQHLDLVRRLGVIRTPTTFVLDPAGGIVTRASGAPRKADVIAALGRVIH